MLASSAMMLLALTTALASVPGTVRAGSSGNPVVLTDITTNAGINMPHTGGGQHMTGQVIADFDGDGLPDLFLTRAFDDNRMYRNQGDGTFALSPHSDQVAMSGLRNSGALALDYDNDGWQDLLVLGWGHYRLFRNLPEGGFEDVTIYAGLTYPGRGTSAAAADFNRNGYPDLYITNFSYTGHPTGDPACDGNGGCDATDRLYINNGDGTFTDVTADYLDLETLDREGFAAVWVDTNDNGWLDLYIVNDRLVGNVLYRNDGPGCDGWCFTDVSAASGLDVEAFAMGIAAGDYDNDGHTDLFVSDAFIHHLFRNLGMAEPGFEWRSDTAGVNPEVFGWGTLFVDFDNDGWLDVYLNTESSDEPDPGFEYLCTRAFQNLTDGTFDDISEDMGTRLCGPNFGIAAGDLTANGRLDLVIGRYNRDYRILSNDSDSGNFLRIRPVGGNGVSRGAAGTRVWLIDSAGNVRMRDLHNGIGLGGGSEQVIHFGLGQETPQTLYVRWPNGAVEQRPCPEVNQTVDLAYDGLVFSDEFATHAFR